MDLHSVFPAIPTPFVDDVLDEKGLRANVARWARTPLRGLLALGSNGEASHVDGDESVRVVETVREAWPGDRILIAGAGHQSTRQTIAAARAVARAGADLALIITPYAFKSSMTTDALVAHFSAVADASPIPILLYNVPPRTGVTLPLAAVERLATHPNIAGLKDSSGDVGFVCEAAGLVPATFNVLVGVAPNLLASLGVGAIGGIVAVASVFPELCLELHALARAGRRDEALALQRALTPLARAVTSTHGPAGLKAAIEAVGYVGGPPRLPLPPLPASAIADIRKLVAQVQNWAASRQTADATR
jgi:4-hydroxy-2-oxoglutarate aldolase